MACTPCDACDNCGWGPMLKNPLWTKIAREAKYLCFDCMEERLGRELKTDDFTDCSMNVRRLRYCGGHAEHEP